MTKMAAMPIMYSVYGELPLRFFFWNQKVNDLGTWYVAFTKLIQVMILGWHWPTKHQGQICFLLHFNENDLQKLILITV